MPLSKTNFLYINQFILGQFKHFLYGKHFLVKLIKPDFIPVFYLYFRDLIFRKVSKSRYIFSVYAYLCSYCIFM